MDELTGGERPKLCGAKTRSFPFAPCKNPAGRGTDHPGYGACRFHGGSTPNHQAGAARQRLHDETMVLLRRENLKPLDNPLLELQKLAAEVVRWKDLLGDQVEKLHGLTYEDLTETEQIRALILAFERGLDRCNAVLSGMVRLDIEERLARLSAAQAAVLIRIVETVLESREMDLPREKRLLGRSIVAREVQAVVAAPPAVNGAVPVPS